MSPFQRDPDYIEVKDRLREFRERYPHGFLRSRIVETPFLGYIAVQAFCYVDGNDDRPATGLAWEPVPGRTPYTKDSELQNAETSAWGRALVAALVADTSRGIASADEIRNRSADRRDGTPPTESRSVEAGEGLEGHPLSPSPAERSAPGHGGDVGAEGEAAGGQTAPPPTFPLTTSSGDILLAGPDDWARAARTLKTSRAVAQQQVMEFLKVAQQPYRVPAEVPVDVLDWAAGSIQLGRRTSKGPG